MMSATSNEILRKVVPLERLPKATEHSFTSWDNVNLFYRAWQPAGAVKRAIILFHGGHEHSGRFDDLVQRLGLNDFAVFAWDARGHGRSPGVRGYANHFHDFVKDADRFLVHINANYGIKYENMVLIGHSVGSVIISTWLHDYGREVRGAVLGSPAFHVKLYAPFALPALRLLQQIQPDAFVNSYVRPGFLTHDRDEADARRQDDLISPKIAVRVLTSLFDTANRVIKNAASIQTPVLILSAGSDWVVKRNAHEKFFSQLGSKHKALQLYPHFYHEVFHEKGRQLVIDQARDFITALFDKPQPIAGRGHKDQSSQRRTPAFFLLRRESYRLFAFLLRTVGCLSDGIRLGWQVGFDAGQSLDYVYTNNAAGWSWLGKFIDRNYLNSIGWRRIRQRRMNLLTLLAKATNDVRTKKNSIQILDVASGPGRLVLDHLSAIDDSGVAAICKDNSRAELEAGRSLAEELGIRNISFEHHDAFDPACYATLDPRPDIVIVSGLYELFADNKRVLRSLRAINGILLDDGYLIFTNQPHHPQLELIAETLVNRDGDPWVMRPRPQSEMLGLLKRADFVTDEMLTDEDGIFVAGIARKVTKP
jgi:alpha-beta hydrolase superfamily lysophospholipase/SAM-dependent methyltransferase